MAIQYLQKQHIYKKCWIYEEKILKESSYSVTKIY